MFFGDGGSYIGEWRDDLFQGHGARLLANGDTYIGDWDRGLEKDKKGWKVCHSESSKLQDVEAKWQDAGGCNERLVEAIEQRNFAVSHLSSVELIVLYLKLGIAVTSVLSITLSFTFYVKQHKTSSKDKATEVENSFAQHILQHIQGGIWVKRLPQGTEKEVKVTFMNNEFQESFCCNCPLDKVVKMSIQNQFGVEAGHQEVYLVKQDGEELLSPLLTLSQCHIDLSVPCLIKVKMRPVPTVKRTDLTPEPQIGRGSYGRVFECEHKITKEKFAVKELHGALVSDYHMVEKFQLHEAETVAALEHPNIVKFIGTCPPASDLWIVSELLGCNLKCLITKKNKLNIEEAIVVSWGIAKGMEAIHRYNYMHRDLSVKNIVFDLSGIPKICDFGMAHQVVPRDDGMTFMPGTPFYMAPQMQTEYYTIAGDMWAVGILISEMICGEMGNNQPRHHSLAEKKARSLEEQQTHLSQSAKEEVCRLLKDPIFEGNSGISSLAEYLERRDTCLKKLSVELSPTSNLYPKATHILEKVVEWCLSVVEKERPPFNAIVQLLYCCLTLYYFESCPSPYSPDPTPTAGTSASTSTAHSGWKIPPAYESDITSRISTCYSSLSPLTGRDKKGEEME
ncbi:serine/threonine-protein kinase fused [Pelomyxa schiedti]|nr:serine/threonine-protein kinase fused [Pelomyxa schiedti]